jgi:hypothetical protein
MMDVNEDGSGKTHSGRSQGRDHPDRLGHTDHSQHLVQGLVMELEQPEMGQQGAAGLDSGDDPHRE